MRYVILTPVYVHTAYKRGLEGDNCNRCDTDTGICTDGYEIGVEGTIVIDVILKPVYVQRFVK